MNRDFDTVTGGNAAQYCVLIENEFAQAAEVTANRVDATFTRGM